MAEEFYGFFPGDSEVVLQDIGKERGCRDEPDTPGP